MATTTYNKLGIEEKSIDSVDGPSSDIVRPRYVGRRHRAIKLLVPLPWFYNLQKQCTYVKKNEKFFPVTIFFDVTSSDYSFRRLQITILPSPSK